MSTLGAMQDFPLRVMRLVDHADREHGDGEIVTAWADGSKSRTNWRAIAYDARRMAQALEALAWEKPKPTAADRRAEAKAKGYEGEMCGECGNFTLVRNGTCMKCDTCGSTTGCS